MTTVNEILELKSYLVEQYHNHRVSEQSTDQTYIDDGFEIDYLPEGVTRIKTGKAYRMVSAPAEHIVSNTPKLYREPVGKGTEQAERVASECNRWLRLMLRQNPQPFKEHIKKQLGKGESWIYTVHNNSFKKDDPNDMPVQFVIPDPTVVFVDPRGGEVDGVPNRLLMYFERAAWDIKRNYPFWPWTAGSQKDWSTKFPFLMYWDNDVRYTMVEAEDNKYPLLYTKDGDIENDGIQDNIYGFVPFVHCYSGFGEGSADGDPAKLAVSRIRNIRDLIAKYTAIESVLLDQIMRFSYSSLDYLYDPSEGEPPSDFAEEYDRSPGAFNTVPVIGSKITNPIVKGTDLLPDQQLFLYRVTIEQEIDEEDPLGTIAQASGTSGRQDVRAEEAALRRYDTIIENSSHAFETAFGQALEMVEKIDKIRPKSLRENDIAKYYEVDIELKADDPIAMQINSVDGDRKQTQGIIDHKTNLINYQGYTQEEAEKIMARQTVDVIKKTDPIIQRLVAVQVERTPLPYPSRGLPV